MSKEFHELVIQGSLVAVREFVNGYLMGKGLEGTIFYAKDEHIETDDAGRALKEMLHLSRPRTRVLVEKRLHGPLVEALRRGERETGLRLLEEAVVVGASFRFSFKAFSEKHGAEILRLFEALPEGVALDEGYERVEERDPEATGVEGYAPMHNYVLRARGTARGDLEGIVTLHREARGNPLVDTEEIRLDRAPPPGS